ncbi:MAG: hypothetical protein GYA14_04515 [Ignavibacteria bacterium]|nr:hypothetical protein [Ignavibacteria bacterium]
MKIKRIDSKKYFVESILSALPKEYRSKVIIKKALLILQSIYAPTSNEKPFVFKKYDLSKNAWNELMILLKDKERLNANEIAYLKFIEQEIFNISLGKGYGKDERLQDFRISSSKGIANTCCYLCGKTLERHTAKKSLHFCSAKENPICYKNRKNLNIKEDKSWRFLYNKKGVFRKPHCAMCNKLITFFLDEKNHFYKGLVFCSQKHMERYRKRELRNQNKLRNISSKIF